MQQKVFYLLSSLLIPCMISKSHFACRWYDDDGIRKWSDEKIPTIWGESFGMLWVRFQSKVKAKIFRIFCFSQLILELLLIRFLDIRNVNICCKINSKALFHVKNGLKQYVYQQLILKEQNIYISHPFFYLHHQTEIYIQFHGRT